ncbi:AraC family transcriptional regulator [Paenibacillus endoradicis]|uniref:AraC family transcriptional regulator n=1 Tax=Paenibacillus endoradicis TaxID=2972487 RepID=UPI00215967AD|nr:AraC family transcriptional regulator [Paenibacillus endoradicis]MCR8657485.1 AraC family transcriptional regulator [Paenibacillus endoradicis]
MDWLQRMNGAISYIEDNLTEEIDYEVAAEIACCSVYHFQRLFSFIVEIPLSEYIRRRRLTLAAFDLQGSSVKVIDIALKYGYDSPEAFARAFQKLHGITPTTSRSQGVSLKTYPRISFQISIKGVEEMNYKIVEKEAFSIFGVESIVTTENGENLRQIPEIWTKAFAEGTIDRIIGELDQPISSSGISPVNAVMCYRETGGMTFPYMLYANMPLGGAPEGYTSVAIPALTWVIFTTVEYTKDQTTEQVQSLWKRIFSEWFPIANYEQVHGPQFEIYGTAESGREYCEVWIPVMKK